MRLLAAVAVCVVVMSFLQVGTVRACTSFCLDTPEGPFFAANLDLFVPGDGLVFLNRRGIAKTNVRPSANGDTAKWVSEYGSVTFNLAGRGFVWSGMNEAGLVVSSMELKASRYPKPDARPPFDLGSLIQYVLDVCGSVPEAVRLAAQIRPVDDGDSPGHMLIADASGECVALEYLKGQLVCYTGESLPVKAMTNIRYARALAFFEGRRRWWWSNPGHSAERFAAAAVRMKGYDANRDTCAASYALETLTHVVAAPNTKWSIVYDLVNREVWFRSARSPTIKRLSMEAVDLSCEAPLLTLDVNAELAGNIEPHLMPYDRGINASVFRTFCERYRIKASGEDAARLMRLLESFRCAK